MAKKVNPIARFIAFLLDILDRGIPLPKTKRTTSPLYFLLALSLVIAGPVFGFWASHRPVYADVPEQKFLIIHDSADQFGELCYKQTTKALDYAKIAHDSLDLSAEEGLPDLSFYSGLLFTTEFIKKLDEEECGKIKGFVANGGNLTVLYPGWNPHLGDLFGIANQPELVQTESGLRCEEDFFPGVKGLEIPEERASSIPTLDVVLSKDDRVMATSITHGKPLLWQRTYGKGRVLFWNGQWLSDMETRGFIIQSILASQGLAVASIANIGVIFIDDFPQDSSTIKLEPVKTEFNLSMADFYSQVWFPDMVDIARRYDLKYTGVVLFNYNGRIEPPFDFRGWEHAKVKIGWQEVPYGVFFGQKLSQDADWELGLHGYNHESLTLKDWESVESMVSALEAARKRWQEDSLGELPFTYVPPHNVYDAAGMEALAKAFPSIKVVAGAAIGDFEEGSNREFGPEPWRKDLFDIPRWTWGYVLNDEAKFHILSELGTFGIWTHFIHPDDVFHTPQNYPDADEWRNPQSLPWRGDRTGRKDGLYYKFMDLLEYVQKHYPWLRYMTAREAYFELRKYLSIEAHYSLRPREIVATFSDYPAYFQVRINDGRTLDLNGMANCQLVGIYKGDGYTIYTLRAVGKKVSLKLILPGEF